MVLREAQEERIIDAPGLVTQASLTSTVSRGVSGELDLRDVFRSDLLNDIELLKRTPEPQIRNM